MAHMIQSMMRARPPGGVLLSLVNKKMTLLLPLLVTTTNLRHYIYIPGYRVTTITSWERPTVNLYIFSGASWTINTSASWFSQPQCPDRHSSTYSRKPSTWLCVPYTVHVLVSLCNLGTPNISATVYIYQFSEDVLVCVPVHGPC